MCVVRVELRYYFWCVKRQRCKSASTSATKLFSEKRFLHWQYILRKRVWLKIIQKTKYSGIEIPSSTFTILRFKMMMYTIKVMLTTANRMITTMSVTGDASKNNSVKLDSLTNNIHISYFVTRSSNSTLLDILNVRRIILHCRNQSEDLRPN